jgi:hypothetical protein
MDGARSLSIRAIDVGFDLRVLGMIVEIPRTVTAVTYDDRQGEARVVRGDAGTIARALRRAGYRVRWADA